MLEIDLDPNLFGGLTWHGVYTALAVAMAVVVVARLAPKLDVDPSVVYSTATWAVPGGIVGARLIHVIDHWGFYSDNPLDIIYFWQGGVALFGAILGGALVGVVYALFRGYPMAKLADLTAPALLIAQAVGRVGDVINGEHFSNPTGLPWSWVHIHDRWPGNPVLAPTPNEGGYHPSVGYEMVLDCVLLFVVWRLVGRVAPNGMVMLIYLVLYSLGRFAIQFTRVDAERAGSLQQGHIIALATIGVALLWIVLLQVRHRQRLAGVSAAEHQ